MRKIILFQNITVDNFMAGPNGELDWANHDDEVAQASQEDQDPVELFLFGRVTYEMMASFWPTPAGQSANPLFANILNNTPKIVFSRTLKQADWQQTEIMRELNKENILKLKQQPGKYMMIFGSGTIVSQLTNLGLIDEYQLLVNPIILGRGLPLFKDIHNRLDLKLVDAKSFKKGVVLLRYQPAV
jgi:dihydrofolate reductase